MRKPTSNRAHLRTLLAGILTGTALLVAPVPALADKEPVYKSQGIAIRGSDTVAYFRQGKLVAGSEEFEHEWMGAIWRFSSQENLEVFTADPEAYAPRYGGYCAWAVSQGYTASTDPQAWRIVDGKLYLNYSQSVQSQWEQNISGNIDQANNNWPGVLRR